MKSGLYGWLNKNMTQMKGRKGQQGFTLIELLVVVTILGVLAAIVTLSLVGLTTNASVQSCNSEYKTVQAAVDAYMAAKNVDTVTATTGFIAGNPPTFGTPTNDMTTPIALYNANPGPASPNYTRNGKTKFYYAWDTHGRITGIFTNNDPANLQTLAGCAIT
jgi:prepilin-type N-terminal cleavage/methylation domain-containing protein